MNKKLILGWGMIIIGVLILLYIFIPKSTVAPVVTQTVTKQAPIDADYPASSVVINNTTIHVDIADTDALREQGLSGRQGLVQDSGMLFVFNTPGTPGFWMKGMNFPLDIIWIDADAKVEGVEKNLLPSTYPNAYSPKTPIKYALEVPAGYYDAHNFSVGMKVGMDIRQAD